MPGKSKKGYAMQMGSHSKVCDSPFSEKDKKNVEVAGGKKPLLPGLRG